MTADELDELRNRGQKYGGFWYTSCKACFRFMVFVDSFYCDICWKAHPR
jgi:hypothetical protein